MEIIGKVHEIGPVVQATDSLKKRELIIEYVENPQYPEYLKFEGINDKVGLLDELTVGDKVEVFFNMRGRPWTDKTGKKTYFNSLNYWKIKVVKQEYEKVTPEYTAPADISAGADDDDLPF